MDQYSKDALRLGASAAGGVLIVASWVGLWYLVAGPVGAAIAGASSGLALLFLSRRSGSISQPDANSARRIHRGEDAEQILKAFRSGRDIR